MTTTDDDDCRNTVPIARPLVRSAKNEIKYFIWLKSHLRLAVLNEFSRVTQWDVSCTHMVTVGVKKDGPNLFLNELTEGATPVGKFQILLTLMNMSKIMKCKSLINVCFQPKAGLLATPTGFLRPPHKTSGREARDTQSCPNSKEPISRRSCRVRAGLYITPLPVTCAAGCVAG